MKTTLYTALSIAIALFTILVSLITVRVVLKVVRIAVSTFAEEPDGYAIGYLTGNTLGAVVLIAIVYFLFRFTKYAWSMRKV